MRISIFNLNNSLSYKEEYSKMLKVLNSKCVIFENKSYNYFEFINIHLFHNWKYRGTYLDCYEYLESIGVNINNKKITQDNFINFLEFILNIQLLVENIKYYYDNIRFSVQCKSVIFHNIPILLEKLNYQAYNLDDRVIISSRGLTYNDLDELVPDNLYELILSYKSINNNSIKVKRIILNKIYEYLIEDLDKFKSYNASIFNNIRLVITKMGVSAEIDKKYRFLSNYKLRKYYDNCFEMMTYLIKTEEILKYRDEIKNVSNGDIKDKIN